VVEVIAVAEEGLDWRQCPLEYSFLMGFLLGEVFSSSSSRDMLCCSEVLEDVIKSMALFLCSWWLWM